MSRCPLKWAAKDAPNQTALITPTQSFTFQQLDYLADTIPTPPFIIPALHPTPQLIAQFFAAWRREQSIFPINPRIPTQPPQMRPPARSLLLYTSGSTDRPKIAHLSPEHLIANAKSAIPALDLRPCDQWRLSLPLYHVGGIAILFRCILARATIVIQDSPSITHLSYIPTHLYRASPVYPHLRCLLLGGAPINHYSPHLPIYTSYGLTEMSSIVTLNGHCLPNREFCIDAQGEIHVRGDCLFHGYYPDQLPPSSWFATKDLGRIEQGKLIITGRKDWMFISGGENIQPEEIERELLRLPHVLEAVVIPINDPEFGKKPVALICTTHTLPLHSIQSALAKRLPKYKIPTQIYHINALPKKNGLKIDRLKCAQMIPPVKQ